MRAYRKTLIRSICGRLSWNSRAVLFFTAKNLEFTYAIRGGELFVSRKEKSITRATVELAFWRALELKEATTGPKKLGVFGASYLYPVFIELGVIPRRS